MRPALAQRPSCAPLGLQAQSPTLVVLEATGGLEVPLAAALAVAGLPVAVVNPRQVRDFAADSDWDIVAADIEDMAAQLGL